MFNTDFIPGHITIFRGGALGDTILTFPVLEALRRHYLQARIRVVGRPAYWELAGHLVDEIVSADLPLFGSLYSGQPSRLLREWLEGTDLAIAWTVRDVSTVLYRAGVSRVIHAHPMPPPGTHATTWFMESSGLGSLSRSVRPVPRIPLSPQQIEQGQRLLPGNAAILLPGAGAAWKRWPAERFARVAEYLALRGMHPVLVEGPADVEAVRSVQRFLCHPLPTLRALSLPNLAAALANAALAVGNDSGVTHLAAATGARTIALFGPTDPVNWSPLGDVRVLRTCTTEAWERGQIRVCPDWDCMEGLPLQVVLDALACG